MLLNAENLEPIRVVLLVIRSQPNVSAIVGPDHIILALRGRQRGSSLLIGPHDVEVEKRIDGHPKRIRPHL